jgi:hypothetical protein
MYKSRGKHPKTCTVTDILKTYNSKEELVKTRYITTHEFMGQTVTEYDVPASAISMGLITHTEEIKS